MIQPVSFEGQTTLDGQPLTLWGPDRLIEMAEPMLPRAAQIVDLGAGRGTNSIYLAMQGHHVHAIENNPEYIDDGRRIVRGIGQTALSDIFVEADMRSLDLKATFGAIDGVVATRSLQEVTKPESYQLVRKIQDSTRDGGLNILRAYIATPVQQSRMPHRALFEPAELEDNYQQAGWDIVISSHPVGPLGRLPNGKPLCQSTAMLIAQKA